MGGCQVGCWKLQPVLSSEDLPEHQETILQMEEEEEKGEGKFMAAA